MQLLLGYPYRAAYLLRAFILRLYHIGETLVLN